MTKLPFVKLPRPRWKHCGYKVITTSDGIEAIALYAQHKDEISVVLMDMMMPSMDGPTTICVAKNQPQSQDCAVSGLASSDKVKGSYEQWC